MSREYISLSCINVGTGQGGTISMLGRVSLIDWRGNVVYDTFVQPTSPVVSYREATTGLDASYFATAVPFEEVQVTVAGWIADKIVVGHQLWNHFQMLGLSHPAVDTRDVALFLPFRLAIRRPNDIIGLSTLMWMLMRRKIQERFVDPQEDARAAMDLYRSHDKEWEDKITEGQWPCALPPAAFSRCYT